MDPARARIRRYRADDLDALYEVCLLTADNGGDGTRLYADPRLPGLLHAAPYGLFEPGLAFVVEDAGGVGGYIVGARDSRAFEARLELEWWPPLRARYPEPPAGIPEEQRTGDQRQAWRIHHRWLIGDELYRAYPSHLHINLVPRLQSGGWGRKLIDTQLAALRQQGSPGVHLFVHPDNTRARGFYAHVGFTELPDGGDHAPFVMDLAGA
ncbi:MAG TPA: GNAT family N-acetyltransferase [Streptosporangiaceae bacterium]|nr:GNAT family N-acetyltransferase [Streptosporangiaceae bacterium]